MKTKILSLLAGLTLLAACSDKPKLNIDFSDKFEGMTVELLTYGDSIPLASAILENGKAELAIPVGVDSLPILTRVMVDGRTRAYYVLEQGQAYLTDSLNVAVGTPLNDRFGIMLAALDSVESLDDINAYTDFAEARYNENKDNVLGQYFGIEWLKYADPMRVDSMLRQAPAGFADTSIARHYIDFAHLRAQTAVGQPYTDFEGEDVGGRALRLSQFVRPGRYTLVDFWAGWCPYCVKELPEIADLYSSIGRDSLEIVGVAVRDKTEDTKSTVDKYNVTWPVIYNTQRRPYDIYGFSGIPHHILIDPDGVIISRGESISQIRQRLIRDKE